MAYEFNRLADVEALTEVPGNANALVEVNGAIKRVPGTGLGGGGIKTAIIKASNYDDLLAGSWEGSGEVTYECTNMTYEEAYQTFANGEPLNVVLLDGNGGYPLHVPGDVEFIRRDKRFELQFWTGSLLHRLLSWEADSGVTEITPA